MGQYQTFIVRIWTDGTASSPRGHIQHIASRRGKYFRDEAKLLRFIQEFLEPARLPVIDPADDTPHGDEPTPLSDRGEAPREIETGPAP